MGGNYAHMQDSGFLPVCASRRKPTACPNRDKYYVLPFNPKQTMRILQLGARGYRSLQGEHGEATEKLYAILTICVDRKQIPGRHAFTW